MNCITSCNILHYKQKYIALQSATDTDTTCTIHFLLPQILALLHVQSLQVHYIYTHLHCTVTHTSHILTLILTYSDSILCCITYKL